MNTKSGNKACVSAYLPVKCAVERVTRLTEKERLFRLRPADAAFDYAPGQFFMAGLPGFGEAPFSVASACLNGAEHGVSGAFEFCIRAVGSLTNALHRLKKGDSIWVRGPFGRGFDLRSLKGKDLLFVAGGIGVVPMRGLIKAVMADRASFGSLTLIYGSKTPDDMLFGEELTQWKDAGLNTLLTIDAPNADWKGHVGVVTTLMPGLSLDPAKSVAIIIGPPVMYKFVVVSLWNKRIPREHIYVSLERRMKCGVGKCGHCQINGVYTCQEGPVFRLSELKHLPEAL